MKIFKSIDRTLEKTFKSLSYVSGIVCAFMVLLSVANVITRIFGYPIFGTVEIISYSALLLGAFALALNEISEGNVTMTLLTDALKPKPKHGFEFVTSLISGLFYSAIAYRFIQEIFHTLKKSTFTSTVGIPWWLINTIMAIGFITGALALFLKAARAIYFLAFGKKIQETGGDRV